MKAKVLFRNGTHITDLTIQYGGKICIMSGGVGGEFCTYIPIASEPALLKALNKTQKNWFKRMLPVKNTKEEIFNLMVEKFSSNEKDPDDAITKFLKDNNIKFTADYWPNR